MVILTTKVHTIEDLLSLLFIITFNALIFVSLVGELIFSSSVFCLLHAGSVKPPIFVYVYNVYQCGTPPVENGWHSTQPSHIYLSNWCSDLCDLLYICFYFSLVVFMDGVVTRVAEFRNMCTVKSFCLPKRFKTNWNFLFYIILVQ